MIATVTRWQFLCDVTAVTLQYAGIVFLYDRARKVVSEVLVKTGTNSVLVQNSRPQGTNR